MRPLLPGFSLLAPTYHRLEIDGRAVFSCCALWAHVIPKLIDRNVRVESIDPHSNELVHLELTPEKVTSVNPNSAVATMAVADSASIETNVKRAFCSHVRHFASPDSAGEFVLTFSTRRMVSIDELHDLAGKLLSAIWSHLDDGLRVRT